MAQKVTEDLAGSSSPLLVQKTRLIIGYLLLVLVLAITTPVYFWLALESSAKKKPCEVSLSVVLGNFTSFPNGSIVDATGEEYPEGFYFTTGRVTRGCLCALKPCVRKCCVSDEWYVKKLHTFTCANTSEEINLNDFTLSVYETPNNISNMTTDEFQILHGDVCPFGKFWMNPSSSGDRNYLLTDGRIVAYGANEEEIYFDASDYCLDRVNGSEVNTFICAKPDEDLASRIKYTFYPVGLILSIFFLFATLVVYALLPDLHGNLHGQSLMCHVFSLMVACVILAVVQLKGDHMSDSWCVALGEYVGVVVAVMTRSTV